MEKLFFKKIYNGILAFRKDKSQAGFTFVESMVYVFVMTIILMTVSNLFINSFNARKQSVASYSLYSDARFIANFLNNRMHNVNFIQDEPLPSKYIFYNLPNTRFDIFLAEDNLLYREAIDDGSGFAEQSSIEAAVLNSRLVRVESFDMLTVADSQGNENQGVKIDFVLSTGDPGDRFAYKQKAFSLFISLR